MKIDKDLAIFGILILLVGFVFVPKIFVGSDSSVLTGNVISIDSGHVRDIQLQALQWDWSEPTIIVNSGELVRIRATSNDVAHGIAIPVVDFNLLIEPGKTNIGEFIAPSPGEYSYGCSVMCGPGHHNHRGKLIVI